ncbi:MAG: polyphosphate polymerase domain-containing protein [Lachnospiraceae bacterium]|nr:polyphosphate polymerase domain-containing protein [Lachnospiraceae bacterium]
MPEVLRNELKYIVNEASAAVIRNALSEVLEPDSNGGEDGYVIRSLYFDTPDDADFSAKLDGLDVRRKIRLRTYDTPGSPLKMELKEKTGKQQRKRSILLTKWETERIQDGEYSLLLDKPGELGQKLYIEMACGVYRPKCIVVYRRTAFVSEYSETRITFDSELCSTESDLDIFDRDAVLWPVTEPGSITMEVKFSGVLMSPVRQIIKKSGAQQVSNSKYVMARTITRHGRR